MKILEVLRENSKLSTQQIAKKTGLPVTTVHNRIKKLKKLGQILDQHFDFEALYQMLD